MALPTTNPGLSTNTSVDSGVPGTRADLSQVAGTSATVVGQTAFLASQPGGATVTCNLATDVLIWRADGALWDDTQQCFLPPYIYQLGPTPRKQ